MKEIKSEIYLSLGVFGGLTILFSIVIFFMGNYFSHSDHSHPEHQEIFTEPATQDEEVIDVAALYSAYQELQRDIEFRYIPDTFIDDIPEYSTTLARFLYSDLIYPILDDIKVELHQKKQNIRGNMRHATLRLFGVTDMSIGEFLSVGIHEFAHYFDIYILEKSLFRDVSQYFYDISWESTQTIIAGQKNADFVSGYAMTNKYEDFAETYTYFVLHNDDFFIRAQQSDILQQKYDFFGQFIFKNYLFQGTDFSFDNEVRSYYWDITKIEMDPKKLLHYLEK